MDEFMRLREAILDLFLAIVESFGIDRLVELVKKEVESEDTPPRLDL
jgi:hypothetical protein